MRNFLLHMGQSSGDANDPEGEEIVNLQTAVAVSFLKQHKKRQKPHYDTCPAQGKKQKEEKMERTELKKLGKERFKANYWTCVLTTLLVTAVLGAIAWLSAKTSTYNVVQDEVNGVSFNFTAGPGSLLSLLIGGPLSVGLNYFFIQNVKEHTESLAVTTPFKKAFDNYPRKLGGTLWMSLFVFLWSLLFIIPGIIKSISYAMTPYILADCPDVKAKDALKLSMRMMKGHKMEYFVLGLSFIGWILLSVITLGLVEVFYAGPYMENTFAAYYLNLKEASINTGVVTAAQFDGTEAA